MSKISYEIWKRQVSYDGENYIDMEGVYKIGEVIIGDVRCGDIQPIYRWYQYPITERYDCDRTTFTKYQVAVYQVSYDRGINYQDVVPYQFKRSGDTISNSEDCGYTPPPEGAEYRWELMPIDSEYFDCDETTHTKYQVRVYQVSYDKGATWQNVSPYQFIRDGISTPNSEDCGYTPKPQEPKYRWQLIPITTDYDCDYETHTKYQIKVYQVSTDGGATWNDVVPRQIQRDGLIIENSEDCGYTPPVLPIYRWYQYPITERYDCDFTTYTKYQIAVEQVSYDNGVTWEDSAPYNFRRSGTTIPNSEDCGYKPQPTIEYRWELMPIDSEYFDCDGEVEPEPPTIEYRWYQYPITERWDCDYATHTKYQIAVYQMRINNTAWIDVEPYQFQRSGTTIPNSEDCADIPIKGCKVYVEFEDGTNRTDTFDDCIIPNSQYYDIHVGHGVINTIIGDGIIGIGDYAYMSSELTNVTIPDSVEYIGEYAFLTCSNLSSVTIGNSVKTIGYQAFESCKSLTSITIPNSVKTIDNAAFEQCWGLTSVTIGNSVETIGQRAFYDCRNLTSVTIPNSVTTIGDFAFNACSSLTSVTIPNSVVSIGDAAFTSCYELTSITYKGTKAQFTAIEKGFEWKLYVPKTCIIHCTDGDYPITDFD